MYFFKKIQIDSLGISHHPLQAHSFPRPSTSALYTRDLPPKDKRGEEKRRTKAIWLPLWARRALLSAAGSSYPCPSCCSSSSAAPVPPHPPSLQPLSPPSPLHPPQCLRTLRWLTQYSSVQTALLAVTCSL